MTLDQYSLCPCGNGKKVKFCKCNEHFPEMQTIDRMIVGEQNVAALDRINANLKTMPSEPWLLAMKCDLLLQLRELESLEETSAKFIRLQPDNPLAKLFRALVAVIRGNTEEGSTLLLQSIAESQENMPPMTATVAINLIEMMGQRGMILPALMLAEIMFDMGDVMARVAAGALESLTSHPHAGTLSQETPPSALSGEGTPYGERLAEAEALIANYRISVAKTKLESMQREFGQQPPILQNLLYCQLLLTDLEGAGFTCRKLAASTMLDESQRIYYQAMVYELAPKTGGVTQTEDLSVYVIEDPEFETALASNQSLAPIPVDQLRGLLRTFLDEEVPPKAAFITMQPILQEQFAEVEAKRPGSWLAFYGKQTDKPARLVLQEPGFGYRKTLMEQVKRELGLSSLKRELIEQLHVNPLAMGSSQILLNQEVPAERREPLRDAIRQLMVDEIIDVPFECLGNRTPRECSGLAEHRLPLQALLLSWQSHNPSTMDDADFRHLHQTLQVSRPSLSADLDLFDRVGGAAYYWTDLNTIDPRSLIQLMQSVLARSVSTMYRPLVAKAETVSWTEDFQLSAEYTILNLKTRLVSDPLEAEKLLARIIDAGKQLQLPVGNAILERFEVLNMLDRRAEARQFLESSLRENPNDPVLLQFLQAAMMQQQQMAARNRGMAVDQGMPMASPAASGGTTSSGLWTPDAPASPTPGANPSGGGSKLWIPGQD